MKNQHVHTLIIGSGAAGLAAALELNRLGISDILMATESLAGGTSINTGSDKQTYYKLSLCGQDEDSVRAMAETYFAGGSMHGDLALVEAANSVRTFMNLVQLGIPFPTDEFGQFVGYKTDHDPRQRATSIGPYTSREMCRAMIREVQKREIPVWEHLFVKELCVTYEKSTDPSVPLAGTVSGAIFFEGSASGKLRKIEAQNVIFAVGGPGGLYKTSVYPKVHTGAIGVALAAGAVAQNLPESQFGLASIGFRWNVSGTYMQCVPRFVSTDADGTYDEREFLEEYSSTPGEVLPFVFLKGYQWPFDARKTPDGSSMIDIWVYVETVLRGRRVWLDFTRNPIGFSEKTIGSEAAKYLEKSGAAALPTPIERLEKMNPAAVRMYAEHGIDIRNEKLEIAVCAQHNNGGLAADSNWESINIHGLFPVGEVNGSHGVYRPGGSALNAGQVGALRAARTIAQRKSLAQKSHFSNSKNVPSASDAPIPADETTIFDASVNSPASIVSDAPSETSSNSRSETSSDWRSEREKIQQRMTRAGGFIRKKSLVDEALAEVQKQAENQAENLKRIRVENQIENQAKNQNTEEIQTHRNSYLLLTQRVYLHAIRFQLSSGVGSRGSAIVLTDENQNTDESTPAIVLNGQKVQSVPEDESFRNFVQETWWNPFDETVTNRWVPRREIPNPDSWFENVWRPESKSAENDSKTENESN